MKAFITKVDTARRSTQWKRRTPTNSRQKSKANRRQKSIANGRQDKSIANGRQSKPKDYDRDKAKYEEKHSFKKSCSQPVPKHLRTDADVQQVQ